MTTIVITGASSGIGAATAAHFADQGWSVAATMRRPGSRHALAAHPNITLHKLDVTEPDSIETARAEILDQHARVDVLLNNAGYALMGPFEAASPEQIEKQFNTNVFGLMHVTRAFLPHLRTRGRGVIINVSSIGGIVTFPLMSLYHASKWAVEGFSESLSFELAHVGIRVKLIEPGGTATNFDSTSMERGTGETADAYEQTQVAFMANAAHLGIASSPPASVAAAIFAAATDGSARLRYPVGVDAEQLAERRGSMGGEAFVTDLRTRMFGSDGATVRS